MTTFTYPGLPLSRQKNSLNFPDKWKWTDAQNLATQILILYIFSIHSLKIVWVVESTHCAIAKVTIRYAINIQPEAKLMLWYQSVLLQAHYKGCVCVLQQIFPNNKNFPDRKKFPDFCIFPDHFRIPGRFQVSRKSSNPAYL